MNLRRLTTWIAIIIMVVLTVVALAPIIRGFFDEGFHVGRGPWTLLVAIATAVGGWVVIRR